jgi:hypothetical protein
MFGVHFDVGHGNIVAKDLVFGWMLQAPNGDSWRLVDLDEDT